MKFLFDGGGRHVANFVKDQLYSPKGENVGHYLEDKRIFVDMDGAYLGEIIHENRIVYNLGSIYRGVAVGKLGNYPNVGNFGSAGTCGVIGAMAGYEDIPLERLGQGL